LKGKGIRRILIALLLVAVIGAGLWWGYGRGADPNNSASTTARVSRRDFTSTVLATGAIKPRVGAEVRVGARISGKVVRLLANIGDIVKKGQVIAELEKADLEALVAQRRAELQLAEAKRSAVKTLRPREIEKAAADVAQRDATLHLAKKELARQDDLLKKDFTSQQAWDRAQERLSVAAAQVVSTGKTLELARTRYTEDLKQVLADVARAKATLDHATAQLAYATITASISGVIASVSTQEGETVAAGLNAPTFVTIIDLNRLQVDAYVDEVDIGKVHPGQTAVFTVDAFPAREFDGKVVAIYPKAIIQENVVNYDVVIEIAGSYDGLLRPEMTASVAIALEKRKQVLAVPARAVKRERGKNIVYIVSKTGSKLREVKVGWKDGQWIEIAAGLEEGQAVLLETPSHKNTDK
jgi:HlyD family secretion protein